MSHKTKKKPVSTNELYYELNVEKLIIHVHKGGDVKILSGQPTPPPKPPGGGH